MVVFDYRGLHVKKRPVTYPASLRRPSELASPVELAHLAPCYKGTGRTVYHLLRNTGRARTKGFVALRRLVARCRGKPSRLGAVTPSSAGFSIQVDHLNLKFLDDHDASSLLNETTHYCPLLERAGFGVSNPRRHDTSSCPSVLTQPHHLRSVAPPRSNPYHLPPLRGHARFHT